MKLLKKLLVALTVTLTMFGTANLALAHCGQCGIGGSAEHDHDHGSKACVKCEHEKSCAVEACDHAAHNAKCTCPKKEEGSHK